MLGFEEFDRDAPIQVSYSHPREEALKAYLGPTAKQVIINDWLPPGTLFMTANEIIVSSIGWERLVRSLESRSAVREIVERVLAIELAWLREAGHEV